MRKPWPGLAVLLLLPLLPLTATAQVLGWQKEVEAGGTMLFGNTQQRLATLRTMGTHADSAYEMRAEVRFAYGEAANDSGQRFVNARSWVISTSFTHQPFAHLSSFAFSTTETSLQQAIRWRNSLGAGAKYTLYREGDNRLDVSGALLGERTTPTALGRFVAERNVARWSARVRGRRRMDERLLLTHETFYQPQVNAPDRYTVRTHSGATLQLTKVVGVQLSVSDSYDSIAILRGARSNHDGQMVFGVLGKF